MTITPRCASPTKTTSPRPHRPRRGELGLRAYLILLVVAAVLPVLAFSAFAVDRAARSERATIETQVRGRAQALAATLEHALSSATTAMNVLAGSTHLRRDDFAGFHRRASDVIADQKLGAWILLSDATGQMILNTFFPYGAPLPRRTNLEATRRVFRTGRPQISNLFVGRTSGRPIVSIDVPVLRDGRVVYDLTLAIDPASLGQVLAQQGLPADWIAGIVDGNGLILTRTLAPERHIGQPASASFRAAVARGADGWLPTVTKEGVPVHTAFARVGGTDWVVGIGVPDAAIIAPLRRSLLLTLIGGGVLLVLGMTLAAVVGRRIAGPIADLSQAAMAVGSGARPLVPESDIRELAALGGALDAAHALLCHRDAERRHTQAALISAKEAAEAARREADRANAAKSRFLAAASHDLRQPVQSLYFFTQVLSGMALDPRGRETLGHVEGALDALKSLLDSLLDISKLDAGIITVQVEEFPIAAVLDSLDASYAPAARDKRLDWRVMPCPAMVRSDPALLGRMLRNLVENALRYTSAGAITIECRAEDGGLRIAVHDTGIGIPLDSLDDIFMEFHQLANPERDRRQGLGLGLAIVRRLADLLGHRVEVRSRPGEGSVFSVTVPLAAAAADPGGETSPATAPPRPTGGRFAVVIDDEAIVLMGLCAMLEAWNYRVLAATSAQDALARLKDDDGVPDVIVADYRLGAGRTGVEAIRELRRRFAAAIPSLLLTGETGSEALDAARDDGIGIVHKPVTPRLLHRHLDRMLKAA